MAIQRMHHVGVVVDDFAAATALFQELGLEVEGEAAVEECWVDRVQEGTAEQAGELAGFVNALAGGVRGMAAGGAEAVSHEPIRTGRAN